MEKDQNFKTIMLDNKYDWGKYRITIDYKEDVDLVREIVRKLNSKNLYGSTKEIIEIIEMMKNYSRLILCIHGPNGSSINLIKIL